MKITILGSGSSRPIPRDKCRCELCKDARKKTKSYRMRSSVFFEYKKRNILIDCGPDFKKQINLLPKKNKQIIDAVLLTHAHKDACDGLKFLNELAKKQGTYILIYALLKTFRKIKNLRKYKHLKTVNIEPGEEFQEGTIKIVPILVHHGMKTLNYPTLGFRVNNTIFASDCAGVEKEYLKFFREPNTMFLDGSMWLGRQIKGHFNVKDAVLFGTKVKAKTIYLTHIGHSFPPHNIAEKEVKRFTQEVSPKLKVELTYDGMKLKL